MSVLLSTNVFPLGCLKAVEYLYKEFGTGLGYEILPMFNEASYEAELEQLMSIFSGLDISFHGPYYKTEHSAPKGSAEYNQAMELVKTTLDYCKRLNSRYVVFHHNNCMVSENTRENMVLTACENYKEINERFGQYGIPVVVENAGVIDKKNMLFNQQQFIDLCKEQGYRVLIDIGHAHANGWDLKYVMEQLKDQIVAYHLHNNDGVHDSHQRIYNGTLKFDAFLDMARQITPNADWVLEYAPNVMEDIRGIAEDIKLFI